MHAALAQPLALAAHAISELHVHAILRVLLLYLHFRQAVPCQEFLELLFLFQG